MNIITRKVRLVPSSFTGTRIRIKLDDPESLTWGIANLSVMEGGGVIAWGDGSSTELSASGSVTHDYAQPGEYEVRISDTIGSLRCSRKGTSPFRLVYAKAIQAFRTNARVLEEIEEACFNDATELSIYRCGGSGVEMLGDAAFRGCTSLTGRLDLPRVSDVSRDTFEGCLGITELHFSEANEEIIRALPGYAEKGAFGATNATVFFDL